MSVAIAHALPRRSAHNCQSDSSQPESGGHKMLIAVGQAAPDFTLKDQNQKEIKLSDYRGKNVVLILYPLDWSPVCTNEHACMVNDMKRFEQLNAQVLGLASIASGRTRLLPKR
jgi:hypothetical protein